MRIRQIDAHMMGRHWCQKKKVNQLSNGFETPSRVLYYQITAPSSFSK